MRRPTGKSIVSQTQTPRAAREGFRFHLGERSCGGQSIYPEKTVSLSANKKIIIIGNIPDDIRRFIKKSLSMYAFVVKCVTIQWGKHCLRRRSFRKGHICSSTSPGGQKEREMGSNSVSDVCVPLCSLPLQWNRLIETTRRPRPRLDSARLNSE